MTGILGSYGKLKLNTYILLFQHGFSGLDFLLVGLELSMSFSRGLNGSYKICNDLGLDTSELPFTVYVFF